MDKMQKIHNVIWFVVIAILLASFASLVWGAASQNVNLSWVAPTTREDGSTLNVGEIWKYEVWWRDPITSTEAMLAEVPQGSTTYATSVSTVGNVCFWLFTIDTTGLRSSKSEEACKVIGGAPGAVTGITITINGYSGGATTSSATPQP